jgi:hypothetical protein
MISTLNAAIAGAPALLLKMSAPALAQAGPAAPPQCGRDLHAERFIHGEICKARPDVNAAVHTHAPPPIPFSVTKIPLRPTYHGAAFMALGIAAAARRTQRVFLVKNAALQQQALALGAPITYLDPEEARLIEAREGYGLARAWEAWTKKADVK